MKSIGNEQRIVHGDGIIYNYFLCQSGFDTKEGGIVFITCTTLCVLHNYTGTDSITLLVVALQKMAGKNQAKGSLEVSYTEHGDS